MAGTFDPYQTWLGIGPHERPLGFYTLLGLNRFEADPARIQMAASQRLAFMQQFAEPLNIFIFKLLRSV